MLKHIYNLATDKYTGIVAGFLKFILFLLSLIYGLIIRVLSFLSGFKSFKPECKVLSVGNITLGGTGKTPLVEYLAKVIGSKGKKVAIVTRGYKKSQALESGDEALMLQNNLKNVPVIVDKNRIEGIKCACLKYAADLVILDDGFQQWKLKKDLEIVVISAVNPFGNKHMIPRGILREPLSALARADIFVLTKVNLVGELSEIKNNLRKYNSNALIFESVHDPAGFRRFGQDGQIIDKKMFASKRVALISGIADPDSFEKTIQGLGAVAVLSFKFADHHQYCKADLDGIAAGLKGKNVTAIITTAKDAVKLKPFDMENLGIEIFVLVIELKIIKDEEKFISRLSGLCGN